MARLPGPLLLFAAALLAPLLPAQEAGAPAHRYGETPEDFVPYQGLGGAYWTFFREPPAFRGPGRDAPEPKDLQEVRIGVLAPLGGQDEALGERMLAGIRLAVAEANRDGGYRSTLPFTLVVRDENLAWGAAANAAVDLAFEAGVWGILGALEDSSTHVMSRVLLKIEVPVVNTGGTDPTLTEHAIPWIVRIRPDDRQSSYALARRIFQEDGLQRVVVFRANDRYGRVGTREFVDAARRLHHPIVLEMRFENHQTAWPVEIERIRALQPEAVVIWGRAEPAGRVVRALREAGLRTRLYGPDRLVDPVFLAAAGPAAEGMVLTYPFDPERAGGAWTAFREAYLASTGQEPDAVAAYAYAGARYLIRAIQEAGLNRARIRDQLFGVQATSSVVGELRFDTTHNNVTPMLLGRVRGGVFRLER